MTAACMVTTGPGVLSVAAQDRLPGLGAASGTFAVALLAVGGTTLVVYLRDRGSGFDLLLFPGRIATEQMRHPGRMSSAVAVLFTLAGLAMTMRAATSRTLTVRPVVTTIYGTLAVTGALISGIGLLGYLYGLRALYDVPVYANIAGHTAVGMLVAFAGLLANCPACPLMGLVASRRLGGTTVRRLLPVVFGGPVLLGAVTVAAARTLGWAAGFGVIALVAVLVPLLQAGVVMVAVQIERIEEDRERVSRSPARPCCAGSRR